MATYATLDSSNKSGNITLSGGNLIATHNGSPDNWGNVAANQHKTTGKWYYEITVGTVHNNSVSITNSSFDWTTSNQRIGVDVNGWAYLSFDGDKLHNGSDEAYGAAYVSGDVIGVAVDVDGGTIEMYKNGASQGVMYNTGLPADIYFGVGGQTSGAVMTANFGASAFTYSVPSGYNAGLFTGSAGGLATRKTLLGVGI